MPERLRTIFVLTLLSFVLPAAAAPPAPRTVDAVMVSDIHFDPFHDPSLVPKLAAAPVEQWNEILSTPGTPEQTTAFTALQASCHARGIDTPFPLLKSSIAAMQATAPNAAFLTLTGDLLVHGFDCRFLTLMPAATPAAYEAFVQKTLTYVMQQLHAAYPKRPIYTVLGNNDSGCGDYRLDLHSDFLKHAIEATAVGLPSSQKLPEPGSAVESSESSGAFSLTMAAPLEHTRIILLDDLFLSAKYRACNGQANPAAPTAQLDWLAAQLSAARHLHQNVWVLGHIPPGVDPYSTLSKSIGRTMATEMVGKLEHCKPPEPVNFLSSTRLAQILTDNADIIRLGLFGHTHMDELRLLQPGARDKTTRETAATSGPVAIKLVPSISPVNGNSPAFTVAQVDPRTARLIDYRVMVAADKAGGDTAWSQEYRYSESFHEPAFDPAALRQLVDSFQADPAAANPLSVAYLDHYYAADHTTLINDLKDRTSLLKIIWPQYVCALKDSAPDAFAACTCGGQP